MRASTVRLVAAAVLSAGSVALLSRPGEAAGAPTRGALILTSFVENGRTDVRLNESLKFKFSVQLGKGSVDDRSLRVTEVTGSGEEPAVGARIVRGNVVTFDPTRTQRNYNASRLPNSVTLEHDHVFGYDSFQDFKVELPAPPDLHTLLSTRGHPIEHDFNGSFRTNGTYDDPVPGSPYFIGDGGSGILGFEPPRSGTTGLVDSDAFIVFEFSEPMDINTLDPSSNVIVTRIAINEQVPGYVKQDPDSPNGRRFLFVPSVGFGSDTANLQGWDIGVTLTTGITDLAGNALKRPVTFPAFRTRYVPNAPSCSLVTESFNDQKNMDPLTSTPAYGGEWDTLTKGYLLGGFPTAYPEIDMIYTATSTGLAGLLRSQFQEPLIGSTSVTGSCTVKPTGARLQQLYFPADVGVAAAIVSVGWGPSSNALFAGLYPSLLISMGHSSQTALSGTYSDNIDIGSPLLTYTGSCSIPQAKNIKPSDGVDANGVTNDPNATGMWDYPALTNPFEWNGLNQLVIDWQCTGGSDCQIFRAAFVPGGIAFPARRVFGANWQGTSGDYTPDQVVYDTSFKKRRRLTYALSAWYQLASDSPVFAAPIVSPVGQPGGVTLLIELQGADGKPDPFNPGGFIADASTATVFSSDASTLDNHRFFRFRVTMGANLTTNQVAKIAALQFAYCF